MTESTLIGTSTTNSTHDSIETLVVKSACYCDCHLKLGDNDSQKNGVEKHLQKQGLGLKNYKLI